MTDAFEQAKNETTNISSYQEYLVGEGKKFTDVEALAKGKYDSDQHLKTLEAELAELRADLQKRKTSEEVLAEIRAGVGKTEDESATDGQTNQTVETPDLAKLVAAEIAKLQGEQSAESNVQKAVSELEKTVGAGNAPAAIKRKAQELNVSEDFLRSAAKQSPTAFMQLFKGESQASPAMTQGSVNAEALNNVNNMSNVSAIDKELEALNSLRKDKDRKNTFYTPEVQMRILELTAMKGHK